MPFSAALMGTSHSGLPHCGTRGTRSSSHRTVILAVLADPQHAKSGASHARDLVYAYERLWNAGYVPFTWRRRAASGRGELVVDVSTAPTSAV